MCVCVWVWVWAGGERSERARGSSACRLVAELTADCYIAAAIAAIAARCLLRAARAAFCRKGRLVSCRLVPSSGFVGVHSLSAIPGGECDEQTRARCCVGAGAGAGFAAARQTLRWVFELLAEDLRSCLALFLLLRARLLGRERILRRHSGASAPPPVPTIAYHCHFRCCVRGAAACCDHSGKRRAQELRPAKEGLQALLLEAVRQLFMQDIT